jgi:hypothetical protein
MIHTQDLKNDDSRLHFFFGHLNGLSALIASNRNQRRTASADPPNQSEEKILTQKDRLKAVCL